MNKQNEALWTKFENHGLNNGLSKKRIDKLKYMFLMILRGLNDKDLHKVTREDIESFLNKLNRNEYKKLNGENYTGTSKSDIKKFMKLFWKWFKGNNESYPLEVSWIRSKIAKDEKPIPKEIISIKDLEKVSSSVSIPEYKAFFLILFDSGFRIDEFLSITKKDLTWEEYESGQKCFWIKCNRSKTFARKIPIPLFTEDIQTFYNGVYFSSLKDTDLLCSKDYDAIRMTLKRTSLKVLGKELTPHCLRHSSATYWAKALDGDMISLCQRFGWSLSSNEAKDYVRMSGAYEKQTAKKSYTNKTSELEEDVKELKAQLEEYKKALVKVIADSKKK